MLRAAAGAGSHRFARVRLTGATDCPTARASVEGDHRPRQCRCIRRGDRLALRRSSRWTYPFALTFPTMMSFGHRVRLSLRGKWVSGARREIGSLLTGRSRWSDTVDVAVHAENLREHRKGLLVDLVTGRQRRQRHRLAADDHLPAPTADHAVGRTEPEPKKQRSGPRTRLLRITRARSARTRHTRGQHKSDSHVLDRCEVCFGFPTANRNRNVQVRQR